MEGLKVSFDSIQYFYHKYQNSDSYEERLQIVLDLIQVEGKYACYFEIDEEELELLDKFELLDYYEEHQEDLEIGWKLLLKDWSVGIWEEEE